MDVCKWFSLMIFLVLLYSFSNKASRFTFTKKIRPLSKNQWYVLESPCSQSFHPSFCQFPMDLYKIWCVALCRWGIHCNQFWVLSNINTLYEGMHSMTIHATSWFISFDIKFSLFDKQLLPASITLYLS